MNTKLILGMLFYILAAFITWFQLNGQFMWKSFKENIFMVVNQFVRAFVTRKDPYSKISLGNVYFHLSFPKRICLFISSLLRALINYKKVKQDNYDYDEKA